MSLKKNSGLGLAALVFASLALCLIWSCIPTDQKGHTFLEIKSDTAWLKYDTLILSWKDPASALGGDLFTGSPDAFGPSQKVPVDGYAGQKIEITVKGVRSGKTVHVEVLKYDGIGSIVEATLQMVAEGTNLEGDPSPIILGETDSANLPIVKVTPETLFDKSLQWASSNPEVFVVEGTRIIAKGTGSATLTGQLVSNPAKIFAISVTVGVFTAPVEKVDFKTETLTLYVSGAGEALEVIVTPDNADPRVEFKSSDDAKARIENGKIVGLIPGDVSVIAQSLADAGKKDTLAVTVKPSPNIGKPIPSAPVIASLQGSDGAVTVSWAAVEGADSYNLFYGEGGTVDNSGNRLKNVVSPATVTGLNNGSSYGFALTALNASGESEFGPVSAATPSIPIPAAPTINAISAGDAKATVAWAPVVGATSYNLYYAAGATVGLSGTKVPGAVSPREVSDLVNGTQYAFALSALSPGGESPLSPVVTATPKSGAPGAPTNVTAVGGDSLVTITWSPVAGAVAYHVYMGIGATVGKQDHKHSNVTSPFVATGLSPANGYAFAVTAVTALVESELSNIAMASPALDPPGIPVMKSAAAVQGVFSIAWNAGTGATSHNLYYAQGSGVTLAGTKLSGVLSPKSVTGLTECVDYTFAATSVNAKGESALSANPMTAMAKSAAPVVTAASGNLGKCVSDKADFTVTATGSGILTYQWRKDTVAIPGATSAAYSIPSVAAGNAGSYTCVIGNGCSNKVTSTPAVLTVRTGPIISANLSSPAAQHPGNALTLRINATGAAPLTFQWKRNGIDITGKTDSVLSLPKLTMADSGAVFTCLVSNGCGTGVLSNPATLKVTAPAKISLGLDHFLILLTDGSAWSGGYNFSGQLANGTNANRFVPTQVLTGIKDVTAHSLRSFFLKTDGTVSASGNNNDGALGDGNSVSAKSPVAVMTSSGTLFGDVAKIGKGLGGHTLFLKTNGTVWGCGSNRTAALGRVADTAFSNPVAIMVDSSAQLTGIKDIASGLGHSLALASNGTVWAWGRNIEGQLGDGSDSLRVYPKQVMTGVVKIAAGVTESYCLKADGSLWAAGKNQYGQFGNGSVGKKSAFFQIASSILDVASGNEHLLTKQADSSIWASGHGLDGALGTGNDLDSHVPVKVFSTGVAAMVAGSGNSLFLMTDGTLRGVGTAFADTLKQLAY